MQSTGVEARSRCTVLKLGFNMLQHTSGVMPTSTLWEALTSDATRASNCDVPAGTHITPVPVHLSRQLQTVTSLALSDFSS